MGAERKSIADFVAFWLLGTLFWVCLRRPESFAQLALALLLPAACALLRLRLRYVANKEPANPYCVYANVTLALFTALHIPYNALRCFFRSFGKNDPFGTWVQLPEQDTASIGARALAISACPGTYSVVQDMERRQILVHTLNSQGELTAKTLAERIIEPLEYKCALPSYSKQGESS